MKASGVRCNFVVCAFIFLGTLAFPSMLAAADYYVNGTTGDDTWDGLAAAWDGTHGPKKTIQAGIDASSSADTVTVADGTYTDTGNRDLDFGGRLITLTSENGPETCIIDCWNDTQCVSFTSGETSAATFEGFTVRNAEPWGGYGGGIYIASSSPTIRDCVFENCSGGRGGGIYSTGGNPTVSGCAFYGCSATKDSTGMGGGAYVADGSLTIDGCIFVGNSSVSYGGGLAVAFAEAVVTNCFFSGNNGAKGAGAISFSSTTNLTLDIANCTIVGNTGGTWPGTAIRTMVTGDVTLVNSIIWDSPGHSVSVEDSVTMTISYCDFEGGSSKVYDESGTGLTWGAGNFDTEPMLIREYRLDPNSPCRNTGTLIGAPAYDIDNEARPEGSGVDVGVDEYIDTDEDGMPDYWENRYGLDPGTDDSMLDGDDDDLTNIDEYSADTDPTDDDTDDDGMTDGWEVTMGTDPLVDDALDDPDGDGLDNIGEFANNTFPLDWDSDNDLIADGYEVEYGLNPRLDDSSLDPDTDDLTNLGEYENGTDPFDSDTDDDGRNDGAEVAAGTNPLNPDNLEMTFYVNGSAGDDSNDGMSAVYDGTHGPKKTIQAGLDVTVSGWGYTVLVADGIYYGEGNRDINFAGKSVLLKSENGPERTTIDCRGLGRAFFFESGETVDSIVEGFSIINGDAVKGTVVAPGTEVLVADNGAWPDWSVDDKIVCESVSAAGPLKVYSPDGTLLLSFARPTEISIWGIPRWSRDGTMIVGHWGASGSTWVWGPFTINSDGGGFTRLFPPDSVSDLPWATMVPVFSPDKSKILAGSWYGSLELLDIATQTYDWVTDPHAGAGDYTPDGSMILAQSADGFVYVDPATGEQGVTIDMTGARYPSISPDGEFITFDTIDKICILRSTGMGFVEIADGNTPRFGPDSRSLVYARGGHIYRIDLAPVPYGGAVYLSSSSATFRNCIFEENTAEEGGAIYCDGGEVVLDSCIISGNSADTFGGGVRLKLWSTLTINNCLVTDNESARGGGLYCGNSNVTVTNCTIAGNTATTDGGGLELAWDSTGTVTDSILWDNTSPTGHEIAVKGSTDNPSILDVSYSDIMGGSADVYVMSGSTLNWLTGNIASDPLFVSGMLGDYYLSQMAAGQAMDSPCVDSGSDSAANLGLDALTTRTDGVSDSGAVDIGYHAPYALSIVLMESTGSDITIHWNSLPGVSYTVKWSSDMQTWNDVPVGDTGNWTDVGGASAPPRYYQVIEN